MKKALVTGGAGFIATNLIKSLLANNVKVVSLDNYSLRARITAVSLGKAAAMGKIGITCRQPFLGADEWIAEEIKKADGSGEPAKVEAS